MPNTHEVVRGRKPEQITAESKWPQFDLFRGQLCSSWQAWRGFLILTLQSGRARHKFRRAWQGRFSTLSPFTQVVALS